MQGLLHDAAVPRGVAKPCRIVQTFSKTVFLLHPLSFSLVPVFLQFLRKSGHKVKIERL